MEKFYDCINCMKTFKVSTTTEPSAENQRPRRVCPAPSVGSLTFIFSFSHQFNR